MIQAQGDQSRAVFPLRAGNALPAAEFAELRRTCALEQCKWDPQLGDQATLASFPVFISETDWACLARSAETLAAEADAAERELLLRAPLLNQLGLPLALRQQFLRAGDVAESPSFARVLRFDFHFTREGWRVSEVNSDVPGGFSEAEGFSSLMARCFSGHRVAGEPASSWADRAALALDCEGEIALLSAPGYMEDAQVVAYLASFLRARGFKTHLVGPSGLRWKSGQAFLAAAREPLAGLFRFYQLEWLPACKQAGWSHFLFGGATPVSNPGRAALSESKRFPLVWRDLRTRLPEFARLLPETRAPREVARFLNDGWLLKGSYSNCGDAVISRRWTSARSFRAAWARAVFAPQGWVAQREFDVVPLDTPLGALTHCLGVYVVDGRAAGAYLRLSPAQFVDSSAIDAALLIAEER